MAVGIKYTGTDGRTTSFRADSPSAAIGRLRGISGYSAGAADGVASELAGGWRSRHKERAKAFAERRNPILGSIPGKRFASGGGLVSEIPSVSEVTIRDGKVVSHGQSRFVDDSGATVAVGAAKDKVVGDVGVGKAEVERIVKPVCEKVGAVATSLEALAKRVDAIKTGGAVPEGKLTSVISDISFDASNGPLRIIVTRSKVRILETLETSREEMDIGQQVCIHENMGDDVHALAYVLSKTDISRAEANAYVKRGGLSGGGSGTEG